MTVNCFETGTIGPCMSSMGYKKKNFKLEPMKLESGFYATDKDEMLVVFGGKIRISGFVVENEDGSIVKQMCFSELPENHEIGEYLEEQEMDTYNKFYPVRLEFYDDRSIDVLIEQLQELKSFTKEK